MAETTNTNARASRRGLFIAGAVLSLAGAFVLATRVGAIGYPGDDAAVLESFGYAIAAGVAALAAIVFGILADGVTADD